MNERRAVWREVERLLLTSLEVDRHIQPHEPRRLNRQRREVARTCAVVLLERQPGVRIEEVEEVHSRGRLRVSEGQYLRRTQVDEVDARAVERARLDDVVGLRPRGVC